MKLRSSSTSKPGQSESVCPVAADFLRGDGKMAGVLPMAARLISLQKDCGRINPGLFGNCAPVRLEERQLTVSAPNTATAARLKQTLPSLKEKLNQCGWNIETIRVKVQMGQMQGPPAASPDKTPLSRHALSALTSLSDQLGQSKNEALKKALSDMIGRHAPGKAAIRKQQP